MFNTRKAAEHIAAERSDLSSDVDYWEQMLIGWINEMEDTDSYSIGTAGFVLEKVDGEYILSRHIYSLYDDGTTFDWLRD